MTTQVFSHLEPRQMVVITETFWHTIAPVDDRNTFPHPVTPRAWRGATA